MEETVEALLNAKDLIPREVCEISQGWSNGSDLQLLQGSFGRKRQALSLVILLTLAKNYPSP